jgi:type I restriction enzyme, S subunit
MSEENGLVPRLRFSEFREAGDWEEKPLGSICSPRQWTTISSTDLLDEGYPVYGANGHIGYYSEYNHEFETVAVTCRGSTCGEVLLIPPKCYITGNSMCLDEINNSHDFYRFIYQLLLQRGFRDVISGSAQPQIVGSAIRRMLVVLPRLEEQKKIADCLSSLDALLAAQGDKLDALKSHKKGLMQQLFPRECETVPRLRFPEFRDAGEWIKQPLTKLFHFQDGFAFKSTDFVNSNGGGAMQVVRISDINNDNKNEQKVYSQESLIKSLGLERYLVKNGDLLLSLTGAAGFNFCFWSGGLSVINQRTCKITPRSDADYPLLRLMEPMLHERLNARGEGQNNNLSKEFLGNTDMLVPMPAEQQRIADCLSSLDALIAAQAEKLDALKMHKQGLMQQLFPSPEAAEA